MTHRKVKSLLCSTALAVCVATQGAAQDKHALVVAGDLSARDVALEMSEALLGLGFEVQRLEAPAALQLAGAVADLDAAEGVTAIYFAGDSADLKTFLRPVDSPRFVFLDACDTSDLGEIPKNIFIATQDDACETPLSDILLERLTVPGLRTDQWGAADGYQTVSGLEAPYVFRQLTSDVRLSADDYAMLETLSPEARDRMVALWRDAGIPVDVAGVTPVTPVVRAPQAVAVSPIRPVKSASVVSPIVTRNGGGGGLQVAPESVTVVSRPLAPPTNVPVAGQGGLPSPSILVGFVVEEPQALPSAPQVPSEPLAGNAFGYEDPTAREELRDQDAALFGGLVESGAFDPPEDEVARALQIELQRINCYTSGIDGAWGPGSQRALSEYYAQVGLDAGTEADVAAFRAVIARNDVRCPDPVVVRAAPQPVAQATRRAQQPAAAQSRRATPAPAPAAPAQPARRQINQTGGTGVFR